MDDDDTEGFRIVEPKERKKMAMKPRPAPKPSKPGSGKKGC